MEQKRPKGRPPKISVNVYPAKTFYKDGWGQFKIVASYNRKRMSHQLNIPMSVLFPQYDSREGLISIWSCTEKDGKLHPYMYKDLGRGVGNPKWLEFSNILTREIGIVRKVMEYAIAAHGWENLTTAQFHSVMEYAKNCASVNALEEFLKAGGLCEKMIERYTETTEIDNDIRRGLEELRRNNANKGKENK